MKATCQPDEHGVCTQCEKKVPLAIATCNAATKARSAASPSSVKEPGIITKAAMSCVAYGAWRAAGSPVRTRLRILEVLSICRGCEHIREADTVKQKCGVCGCPVNDWLSPSANKIALATESCPLQEPRWTADLGGPPAALASPPII